MVSRLAVGSLMAALAAGCGSTPSPVTPTTTPTPAPTPAAVATPTPAPLATPTPVPTPTPCTQGLCEEPTTNTNPPVRLTLRIYSVVNQGGQWIQGLTEMDAIPVGYTVTVDATAKDEGNRDTLGLTTVQWEFENEQGANIVGNHTHQRRIRGDKPGTVLVTAIQDGIRSNTVALQFE